MSVDEKEQTRVRIDARCNRSRGVQRIDDRMRSRVCQRDDLKLRNYTFMPNVKDLLPGTLWRVRGTTIAYKSPPFVTQRNAMECDRFLLQLDTILMIVARDEEAMAYCYFMRRNNEVDVMGRRFEHEDFGYVDLLHIVVSAVT